MITIFSTMTWFLWNMEQIWLCDFDYDCQWRLSTNICSTGNFCKYLPQCLQKYLHDCICATKWAILLQTSSSTRPINHLSINSLTMFEQLVALKCQQLLFSFFFSRHMGALLLLFHWVVYFVFSELYWVAELFAISFMSCLQLCELFDVCMWHWVAD